MTRFVDCIPSNKQLEQALKIWELLSDIPTDKDACIEEKFEFTTVEGITCIFDVGTPNIDIWSSIEYMFFLSIEDDINGVIGENKIPVGNCRFFTSRFFTNFIIQSCWMKDKTTIEANIGVKGFNESLKSCDYRKVYISLDGQVEFLYHQDKEETDYLINPLIKEFSKGLRNRCLQLIDN